MAQTIDITQIWAEQMPEIAQVCSQKQPSGQRGYRDARGAGHDSDGSTGAGSGSSGRASTSDASSSKDGDSDSERDASARALPPQLGLRLPASFRPPPGLEAPPGAPAWAAAAAGGVPAPPRTALRSAARPFLSRASPEGAAPPAAPAAAPPTAAPLQSAAAPAGPRPLAGGPQAPCSGESMRTHLQGLRAEGHRRTLVVRRIHRLGLDSPEKLRAHFEQYGAVEAVLVTHSHVRSERRSRPAVTTRIRPAHLGFVVMGGAEGAEAAVGDGEAHVVLGSPIEVQRFVPHRGEPAGAPRDSDEAADASEGMADDEQDSATESASPSPRRAAAQ